MDWAISHSIAFRGLYGDVVSNLFERLESLSEHIVLCISLANFSKSMTVKSAANQSETSLHNNTTDHILIFSSL